MVAESTSPGKYEVALTSTAIDMLRDIKRTRGKQTYEQLREAILDLAESPVEKTKPLTGLLRAFRSLHLGRFRVVVRVSDAEVRVYVVGVGWHASGDRDDIYQVLQRMASEGRLARGANKREGEAE